MTMNVHYSSNTHHWATPRELYDNLNKEFQFKLDPCPLNPVCDGLQGNIWECCTFINPPYGRGIIQWIKKAYESSLAGYTQVLLIPARTDTKWWHEYIMKADEIRLIKGRLKFGHSHNPAPFPSAIVIYTGNGRWGVQGLRCFPRIKSCNTVGKIID